VGLSLGELLVHGRDLARTAKQPWAVEPRIAVHCVRAAYAAVPTLLDRDRAAQRPTTFQIDVRGDASTTWAFSGSGLTISPTSGHARPDCRLVVDAATITLVMYGRISPLRAALSFKARASGRRPLAALRLRDYAVPF
jgi:hypothetical protein